LIKKVLGYCLRETPGKVEILVLKKLDGKGIEIPGGSVEENESFEEAVIREIHEETGINAVKSLEQVLTIVFHADWRNEWQERNIFKVELENTEFDEFDHVISDGKEDKGKAAKIFWLDIEKAKEELLWGQGQFIEQVMDFDKILE